MVVVGAASGCAGGLHTSLGGDVVDRGYKITGTRWGGEVSGVTAIALRAYPSNGNTALCAAWGWTDPRLATVSTQYAGSAKLYLAGDAIVNGFAFGERLGEIEEILGAPASCVETGTPWKAAYADAEPELRAPRRFYVD